MEARKRVTCSCGKVFRNESILGYHQSVNNHPALEQPAPNDVRLESPSSESRAEEIYRAAVEALRAKREEQMAEESFDARHYFESTSGVDPSAWPTLSAEPDSAPDAVTMSVEFAVEASYQRAAYLIRREHERKRLLANREAWALAFAQAKPGSGPRAALSKLILLILLVGLGVSGAGVGAYIAGAMQAPAGQPAAVADGWVQPT